VATKMLNNAGAPARRFRGLSDNDVIAIEDKLHLAVRKQAGCFADMLRNRNLSFAGNLHIHHPFPILTSPILTGNLFCVKRFEESVLNLERNWVGNGVGSRLYLVSKDKDVIAKVLYGIPGTGFLGFFTKPDTVFEAYRRLSTKDAVNVRYILEVRNFLLLLESSWSDIIVHKIPNAFKTLDDMVDKFTKDAQKKLVSETKAVD